MKSEKQASPEDDALTVEYMAGDDTVGNPLEDHVDDVDEIYYFGFGPIVNEMVRRRRNIHTNHIQAACLHDYRLTFCFGGNASIVAQRGYQVHGLLMTLSSREDWQRLLEYDSGNHPTLHQVFSYDNPDDPVTAYLFEIPIPDDISKLDEPIERLPQERYLKLIAQGLRQHSIDDEYIDYTIMGVPFLPNRKPQDYYTFPLQTPSLPTWSQEKYRKKCAKGENVYFILGKSIFQLNYTDETNPLCKWFKFHAHGKDDCTLAVHKTVVDPEIPIVDDVNDITPLHIAWAENHSVEVVEQYEMSAVKVALLVGMHDEGKSVSRSLKRLFRKNK